MHTGLNRPDGVEAPGLSEASQVFSELKEFDSIEQVQSKVALIFDYESCWAWEVLPQGKDFSYFELVYDYYRALRSLGLSIDIVSPNESNLTGYKVVLMPGLMHISDQLESAIEEFDGAVISGPRTGSKTLDMSIPKNLPPVVPGINGTVARVETLRPKTVIPIKEYGYFKKWMETLVDSDNVIKFCDDGRPAIIGDKKNLYIAGWADQDTLRSVFTGICANQEISITELNDCVRIRDTSSHRFWFNFSEEDSTVGSIKIPASGVFWEKL